MTTRVLPEQFKAGVLPDVWQALTAELWVDLKKGIAKAKPGDVVQNPYADVVWPCDRKIEIPASVRCEWEGATIQQKTLRPFGQTRTDGIIVNGTHLLIPSGAPLIPTSCNWGWVTGPGIPTGTHVVLDYNRRGGTLSNNCVDGTGLPLVFTSQDDRTRAGFRIAGKDSEIHNATVIGAEQNPTFTPLLEAQHGVDFSGATNPVLRNISALHMHGDGLYPGADGTRLTTFLDAQGGTIDHVARSGISPVNCADCTIDQYTFDHIGRTVINIEPPNAGCKTDRLVVKRATFGEHRLTLLSSGGVPNAHVGKVTLSDSMMTTDDAPMWLIDGDAQHLRGPYFIVRNRSTYPNGYGTKYPTAALVCIDHARTGSRVVDNKGFKLQAGRSPGMAFVRHQRSGNVEVHGNDHEGGVEVGSWV